MVFQFVNSGQLPAGWRIKDPRRPRPEGKRCSVPTEQLYGLVTPGSVLSRQLCFWFCLAQVWADGSALGPSSAVNL